MVPRGAATFGVVFGLFGLSVILGDAVVASPRFEDSPKQSPIGELKLIQPHNRGGPPSAAKLHAPEAIDLGSDLNGKITLTNDSDSIERFSVAYSVSATVNGRFGSEVVTPRTRTILDVFPRVAKTIPLVGRWDVYETHLPWAEFMEISVMVTRERDQVDWDFNHTVGVNDLPISVSASREGVLPIGSEVEVAVTVWNPLRHALRDVIIDISGDSNLVLGNQKEKDEVKIGTLGPHEMRVIRRRFHAVNDGYSGVAAWVQAKNMRPGSDMVSINPFRGVGDINEDTVVDDVDLVLFCGKFNLGDCDNRRMDPRCVADLNRDELVNEADFQLFVAAYEAFVCSPPAPEP